MKARVVLPAIAGTPGSVIELDGQDIRNAVRRLSMDLAPGELTVLRLDLAVRDGLSFEGDVRRIEVPEETAAALRRIGWLPPVTELGPLEPEVADRLRALHREYKALLDGVPLDYAAAEGR